MKIFVEIILLIALFTIPKIIANHRLDNYPVSKIDNAKLGKDVANGVSVAERRRRCINGYYDKDKK